MSEKNGEIEVELKRYKLDIVFSEFDKGWTNYLMESGKRRAKQEEAARELQKQKTWRWCIKNLFMRNKS